METQTHDDIRSTVREAYGAVARDTQAGGCCGSGTGCCSANGPSSTRLGYTEADLAAVPARADLGLGCGNPQAIAALKEGERVLDLGSGGGVDVFLAAQRVGPSGHVIGVDMTPEMVSLARANAGKVALGHVEFRLGEIEHLPVDRDSIDVVMSNCVINLAPEKPAVFREAFRVLVPGGRLAIADIVATREIAPEIVNDPAAYAGCIAGAALVGDLERMLSAAGFRDVSVVIQAERHDLIEDWREGASRSVASAFIQAVKPA